MLIKILSGGQEGADLGGLEAAHYRGLETGGLAPKGFKTEKGNNLLLKTKYRLTEAKKGDYNFRTEENVKNSDGTIIFAKDFESAGTKNTIGYCSKHKKPCFPVSCIIVSKTKNFRTIPVSIVNTFETSTTSEDIIKWLKEFDIKTLNVAGNRESKAPGLKQFVVDFLVQTFILLGCGPTIICERCNKNRAFGNIGNLYDRSSMEWVCNNCYVKIFNRTVDSSQGAEYET